MSIDKQKHNPITPERKVLLINYMHKESQELTGVYMDILNTDEVLDKYLELRSSILLYHHIETYHMNTNGWDLDGILEEIKDNFFSELYMWLEMTHLDNVVIWTLKEMTLCWTTSDWLQGLAKTEMMFLKDTLNDIIRNNLRRLPHNEWKSILLESILKQRAELIQLADTFKIETVMDLCKDHVHKILHK